MTEEEKVKLRLECFKLVGFKIEFQDLDKTIKDGEKLFKYITEGNATDTAE